MLSSWIGGGVSEQQGLGGSGLDADAAADVSALTPPTPLEEQGEGGAPPNNEQLVQSLKDSIQQLLDLCSEYVPIS